MGSESPQTRPAQYRYRFGTAEFDEVRVELRVDGEIVKIQRRPLDVLTVLLQHAGEMVTREELREAVWHNRITVDNVLDTALMKLRQALGERNSGLIRTQPRVGFRLVGPVERVAVGRHFSGELSLDAGQPAPHRENFLLRRRLGSSARNEVWLARHAKTQERRVYKFSACGAGLAALKREAAVNRLLRETLGEREDFVRILDWNFEEPPFFLECEYGGENLLEWAARCLGGASPDERVKLLARAADAVAAAHSVGVLHKDLKPANLLISGQAGALQVRVTDFGSAQLLTPDRVAAVLLLEMAAKDIAAKDPDGPISVATIRKLIRAAQEAEAAGVRAKGRTVDRCASAGSCAASGTEFDAPLQAPPAGARRESFNPVPGRVLLR